MFGGGGPFGSMFGGDPFFSDPFAHMDRMVNSMFNDPFFANPLGVGFRPPAGPPLQQAHHARSRPPVIEEVDEAGQPTTAATARDEPIVEEPDDETAPQDRAAQRQRRHSPPRGAAAAAIQPAQMDPFGSLFGALVGGSSGMGGGMGGSSFMFSSSSYSSAGPGGVTYQATSTTRVGPGGVRETQAVVRDGRSGTESVTISRGLGDGRQRTLVRTRDALTGRQEQLEGLDGIVEDQAGEFDDHWRQQAERNLPGGGAFGAVSGRLAAGGGASGNGRGPGAQRPLALPSSSGAGAAGPTLYGHSNAGTVPAAAAAAAPQVAAYTHQPTHTSASRGRQYSGGSAGGTAHRSAAAPAGTAATAAVGRGTQHGQSYTGGAGAHRPVGGGAGVGMDGGYAPYQQDERGGGTGRAGAYGGVGGTSSGYPAGGGYHHQQQVQPRYRH